MVRVRRSISVLCAFLCVFAASVSYVCAGDSYKHHLKECGRVQHEFFHQKIGSKNLVPENPVHDAGVSLCFDAKKESSRKSCCTKVTEGKYVEAADRYLKASLQSSNAYLKKLVTESLAQYQEKILDLLEEAQNRTSVQLDEMHKIPWKEYHGTVSDLFLDLEQYMKHKEVDIKDSVKQFFSKLFPSVFYYILSDPTVVHYDDNYRSCLLRNQEEIQPFGSVPTHLSNRLREAFPRARSYVKALSIIVEAINSTDHILVEGDCRRAVTRLQYCSHCKGYVDVRPCHGFCLNVMRGCLAKISEISPEWDELISTVDNLARGMRGKYNLEEILLAVEQNISNGILQAMDDGPRIYNKVMVYCQNLTSKSDTDGQYKKMSPMIHPTSSKKQRMPHSLIEQINSVLKHLRDSRGIYNRLADGICGQSGLYEQDMKSTNCWNGTDVSEYSQEVPEFNFISQAKYNTEVKVSLIPEYTLLEVKEKLVHVRKNLSSLIAEENMMSDSPEKNFYGSGDVLHDVIIDDEDVYGYGDGSGSGSGDNPVIIPTPKHNVNQGHGNTTFKEEGSGADPLVTGSFLILVMCYSISQLFLPG